MSPKVVILAPVEHRHAMKRLHHSPIHLFLQPRIDHHRRKAPAVGANVMRPAQQIELNVCACHHRVTQSTAIVANTTTLNTVSLRPPVFTNRTPSHHGAGHRACTRPANISSAVCEASAAPRAAPNGAGTSHHTNSAHHSACVMVRCGK